MPPGWVGVPAARVEPRGRLCSRAVVRLHVRWRGWSRMAAAPGGDGGDGGDQDSRIATMPWPPAAQMEIRPRLPGPASCSCLAREATMRPPVAANGWPAASDEPLTL